MEIIIVILIIFAVSSWVKGISAAQNSNNSGRNPRSTGGGYTRTGSSGSSWTDNKGGNMQNSMARTQEQVDYQKVTTRNDTMRELEDRLSKSLKNLTGEPVRPVSRNYAKTPAARSTGRNSRSNNSPMNKSKFNNHTESSAALRDEIQEATQIWHENLGRMHNINMEFQRHIDQQHSDQRKWMRDAQSMDR